MTIPHNGTETSKAAARFQAKGKAQSDEARIYDIFDPPCGPSQGWTCDEIEAMTGLSHQTASARINGLMRRGLIEPTGQKRKTRSGCLARIYRKVKPFTGELF